MKVTLLHFAIHNIDVSEGNPAQTVSKTAFHLTFDTERIHCETAVHDADDRSTVKSPFSADSDFDGLSNRRNIVDADATPRPRPARAACPNRIFPSARATHGSSARGL